MKKRFCITCVIIAFIMASYFIISSRLANANIVSSFIKNYAIMAVNFSTEQHALSSTSHFGKIFFKKTTTPNVQKQDILWFYAFLLLVASIHIIFSIMISIFRLRRYHSKIFIILSFLQGIWYLTIAEFIFTSLFMIIFSIVTAFLTGAIFLSCCYFAAIKFTKKIYISLGIGTAAVLCIPIILPDAITNQVKTIIVLSYLIFGTTISCIMLIKRILQTKNLYGKKYLLPLLYGISISFIIPALLFVSALLDAIPFYAHYYSLFSLAFPLFVGQNIFHYNLFSSKSSFFPKFAILLINLTASTIMAFVFYEIMSYWRIWHPLAWICLCFTLFAVLISTVRNLSHKITTSLILNRANYTRSLQNIELMVATPESLDFKIERIFTEISIILGIPEMRLFLFGKDDEYAEMAKSAFVEILSQDHPLAAYFSTRKDAIFSFELIPHSETDTNILQFMETHQYIYAKPILAGEKVLGVIMLGAKQNGDIYFSHDINYLETIALQIRQTIENNRLLNSYIARRHFEMELDIASFVQSRLFPRKAPSSGKLSISFYNRPYLKVTGDYFDFIEIDKKNTAIIIGDISGHGLAAAMILSMISSTFHALLKEKFSIEKVIEEINYLITNRYKGTELITLFAGVYNSTTGQLRYINAGHCTPLVLKKNTNAFTTLEGRSKIVGADPSALYLASTYHFERGDELFLYTDGATEIYDEKSGRLFSESDLIEILKRNANRDIEGKIHALIEKINSFGDAIKDDVTLIAVRFR